VAVHGPAGGGTAIFVAALAQWLGPGRQPVETLIATMALLSALAMTAFGVWWVELRGASRGAISCTPAPVRRAAGDGGRCT
jgi:hypothetical protein